MPTETTSAAKRPRRFWPRFTLRALIVFVTIVSVGLGYWSYRAREQARIVRHIEQTLGEVVYDYEAEPVPGGTVPKSAVPVWLLRSVGTDFFHAVDWAHVGGEVDLEQVSRLSALRHLAIRKGGLTDDQLMHIARLRELKYLTILPDKVEAVSGGRPDTTRIGDRSLALLATMPALTQVVLNGTNFTRSGLAAMAESKSLRSVWISGCDASVTPADIEPFRRAARVKMLLVYRWSSANGEEELADWELTRPLRLIDESDTMNPSLTD